MRFDPGQQWLDATCTVSVYFEDHPLTGDATYFAVGTFNLEVENREMCGQQPPLTSGGGDSDDDDDDCKP